MKAILAAVFAVLIGVAFSTTTFAQAPSATDKPAAPEMKKDNGKKGEKKEMKKEKKAKKKKDEKEKEKK